MKIIGTTAESYLVEVTALELDRLTGLTTGSRVCNDYKPHECLIGKDFEIREAWNTIVDLQQHVEELPRIAGKLRALADLLEPIQIEIPVKTQ